MIGTVVTGYKSICDLVWGQTDADNFQNHYVALKEGATRCKKTAKVSFGMAVVAAWVAFISQNTFVKIASGVVSAIMTHRAINFCIGGFNFKLQSVLAGNKCISCSGSEVVVDRPLLSKKIYRGTFFFSGQLDSLIGYAISKIENHTGALKRTKQL